MNDYTVNDIGTCNLCGGVIISTSGTPHFCNRGSGVRPYQPLSPNIPLGPLPPDEQRIREIVREELARERRRRNRQEVEE